MSEGLGGEEPKRRKVKNAFDVVVTGSRSNLYRGLGILYAQLQPKVQYEEKAEGESRREKPVDELALVDEASPLLINAGIKEPSQQTVNAVVRGVLATVDRVKILEERQTTEKLSGTTNPRARRAIVEGRLKRLLAEPISAEALLRAEIYTTPGLSRDRKVLNGLANQLTGSLKRVHEENPEIGGDLFDGKHDVFVYVKDAILEVLDEMEEEQRLRAEEAPEEDEAEELLPEGVFRATVTQVVERGMTVLARDEQNGGRAVVVRFGKKTGLTPNTPLLLQLIGGVDTYGHKIATIWIPPPVEE